MNIKQPFKGGKWSVLLDGTMVYKQDGMREFEISPARVKREDFFTDFLKYPYFDWNDFVVNWVAAIKAAKVEKVNLDFKELERFGSKSQRSES